MFLKKISKLHKTLSFKLTLWYSIIFSFCILAGFFSFNFLLSSNLNKELDQNLLSEAKEISMFLEMKGINQVKTMILLEAESEGVEKVFYRLMNISGEDLASSNATHWGIGAGRKAINIISSGTEHFFETISVPQHRHKARVLYSRLGQDYILQIMISMEDSSKFLSISRHIFFTIMGFMFLFSTIIGWFMARRALAGVEEVTQTAIQVSDGKFNKRVKVSGHGEEIDRLAATFNKMLERLQDLIKEMKEISSNIAHDLRSPVTRIRGIAETTLMTAESDPEYEAMAGNIIEECDRLLSMINTMLEISEAEAGISKLNISEIDLSALIRDACELFEPIAEDKKIKVVQQTEEQAVITADKQKIQRLIANLLDNALKYTTEEGTITISIEQNEKEITVSIRDTGIGISEEDLPKIFNRFYRCDRSRSFQGSGLGLSLAQAIVQAHHGVIFASSSLEKGSIFTVTLPRTPLSY